MIHDEHNIDRHNELIEIQNDRDDELESLHRCEWCSALIDSEPHECPSCGNDRRYPVPTGAEADEIEDDILRGVDKIMRNRNSRILVLLLVVITMVGVAICGRQIITASETHVENINERYAEIDKVLNR